VVDIRGERGGGGRNYEIKSVLITMSRKGNVLRHVSIVRVKSRYIFLDLRVTRIIKVKIEITSDKKLMESSGGRGKRVSGSVRKRENGTDL